MKHIVKFGFTIIEVTLFLAISGAIFAMVMVNTSSTAAKRRYNDSVNDLAEALRNAYSETINVQNTREKDGESSTFCSLTSAINDHFIDDSDKYRNGVIDNYPGRTRCAVYGRLITFGEKESVDEDGSTEVRSYDIIGKAVTEKMKNIDPDGSDDVISALIEVGADVVTITRTAKDSPNCKASFAGNFRSYWPQWAARVEGGHENRGIYKGAIMIARSPVSGTVHTYFYADNSNLALDNSTTIEASYFLKLGTRPCNSFSSENKYLGAALKTNKMQTFREADGTVSSTKGITICVGSEDVWSVSNRRRAIKIHGDGSTEAAVEILPADSEEAVNACR